MKHILKKISLVGIGVLLGSCQDEPPIEPLTQAQCLVGYWSPTLDSTCDVGCTNNTTAPECQESDCRAQVFSGFGADDKTFAGAYVFSVSRGTFSSFSTILEGTYIATEETLSVDFGTPSKQAPYTCNGDQLLQQFSASARVPVGVTSVLDQAARSDEKSFTAQPFSPK